MALLIVDGPKLRISTLRITSSVNLSVELLPVKLMTGGRNDLLRK